jgi:hypothetical protein
VSLRVGEQETADRSGPRAVSFPAPSAAEVIVFACLIGFGVASIVAQSPGGADWGGISPALLIGGWVVVFAALATLHARDRRSRVVRQAAEPLAPKPRPRPPSPAVARPAPPALPQQRAAAAIEAPVPTVAEAPARAPRPPAVAEPAPRPLPTASVEAAPTPVPIVSAPMVPSTVSSLERSIALSADGRFVEAARAAHDGLENGEEPGPLLVALSRAHLGRGQIDQAIETARDALFVSRSRDSVSHLIRVLTLTRRFGPEDGPMLRRAADRYPARAMLRHALGVFESLHGEPRAAREQLLAALELEADAAGRRAIERDLESAGQATARTA